MEYSIGAPDPTPDDINDDEEYCYYKCQPEGFCTWPLGHNGKHVAGDSFVIIGIAENETN